MDWTDQQAKYGALIQPKAPKKKQSGVKGLLSSLISEAGGTGGALGGAAVGTAIAPGIGTLIGAGLGGFLGGTGGRVVENEVRDNRVGLGDALKEGAISGVAGAGPIRLLKGAGAATKAVATKAPVAEAVDNTLTKTINKSPERRINMLTQGQQMQGRGLGISGGNKVTGTKELMPQDTARMLKTLKGEGIKTGNANSTARQLQDKLGNYGKGIEEHLTQNNKALSVADKKRIAADFMDNLPSSDPSLVKKAQVLANDFEKQVGDTKGVWNFRKTLDSRIPDSKFTDNATSKEVAAIKAFRGFLSDELGTIPGMKNYHELSEVKPFISKGMRELNQPSGGVIGRVTASGPVQKIEDLAGKGVEKTAKLVGAERKPVGIAPLGTATRILGANALFRGAPAEQPQDQTMNPVGLPEDTTTEAPPEEPDQHNPFSEENIQNLVLQDLAKNGGKNVNTLLSLYKTFGQSAASKPLSAEAAKTTSNAKAGLEALDDFEADIMNNPGAFNRTSVPGIGILDKISGGRASGALGTSGIDAASQQIIDVIARLRTGAAISKEEEGRFLKFIPRPGDPQDVRQQKLGYLRRQFQRVASSSGPSTDLEAAITDNGEQ